MTTEAPVASGRIVLLTASHRVAPGLLSWPAWQTLHAADRVLCADEGHPQLPYLRDAGVEVEIAAPTAQELVDFCAGVPPGPKALGEAVPSWSSSPARATGP